LAAGEVRGNEAIDMLQALNTGHEGSMTTIHANDTRDALARLELLVGMAGYEFSMPLLRQYIATGVKLLVHVGRQKGGGRRILRVSELVAIKDGEYHLEDIFVFRQTGLDDQGRAMGQFHATGYLPKCRERFREAGVDLDDAIFNAIVENTGAK
jgi:pilus assembly protein CpaF